ncbi:Hypothetical_protein [Hexamita inflata]|uniref:Hypothetical_protein n=1 Tax=Hexamita inflata TaxID=28002 RepID=A0ABP1J6T6_9EUKA
MKQILNAAKCLREPRRILNSFSQTRGPTNAESSLASVIVQIGFHFAKCTLNLSRTAFLSNFSVIQSWTLCPRFIVENGRAFSAQLIQYLTVKYHAVSRVELKPLLSTQPLSYLNHNPKFFVLEGDTSYRQPKNIFVILQEHF